MDRASIGVRGKLAALWATLMFLYVYADVLSLYRPGQLDDMRDGTMGPFDVSQAALVAAAAVVIVPAWMIVLALVLPARANRWANVAAGVLWSLVNISNVLGETWVYYWAFGVLEILATCLIVKYAWGIADTAS